MAHPSLGAALAGLTLLASAFADCEPEYEKFLTEFRKTSSPERRKIFCANWERIQEINQANGSFQVDWNERSDWTQEEVQGLLGGIALDFNSTEVKDSLYTPPENFVPAAAADWRRYMPAVKNQGRCGSCWAFAAIDVVDFYAGSSHSEQQLVDCSGQGCGGGSPFHALRYLERYGSISESSYPYRGNDGRCQRSGKQIAARVWNVRSYWNEAGLAAMVSKQPTAICIYGGGGFAFVSYRSGVFNADCGSRNEGHCLGAVGFTSGYWILRNSWGPRWGQAGHMYFKRGVNLCTIGTRGGAAAYARKAYKDLPLNQPIPSVVV